MSDFTKRELPEPQRENNMPYISTIDRLYRIQDTANRFLAGELLRMDITDIEPWYCAILEHLAAQSSPVQVSDLVAVLHRPKASITKATDKLREAGLVYKARNEKDGRSLLVWLTPEGRIALKRFQQAYAKLEEKLFQGTSPQQRHTIKAILAELEENLK